MAHAQHIEQVQLVERLPLLLSAVQEIPCRGAEIADVVHQDVDPRIINGQRGFDHCGHDGAVADVADDDRGAPARRDDRSWVAEAASGLMSASTTCAPAAASRLLMPPPMPRAPPVTTATWPENRTPTAYC